MSTPDEAARTLAHVAATRRLARGGLGEPWFPLVAFGLLVAVAAVVTPALSQVWLVIALWVVGTLVALLAVEHYYRRRIEFRGIAGSRRNRRWATALCLICVVLGIAAGFLGHRSALWVPIVAVFVAALLLGALTRDGWPAVATLPAAGLSTLLATGGTTAWLVELVTGLALIAGGAVLFLVERTRR